MVIFILIELLIQSVSLKTLKIPYDHECAQMALNGWKQQRKTWPIKDTCSFKTTLFAFCKKVLTVSFHWYGILLMHANAACSGKAGSWSDTSDRVLHMSFGAGHCHLGTSVASVLTQVGHQGTSSVACVLTQVSAQAAAALTISWPLTQLLSLVAFTY